MLGVLGESPYFHSATCLSASWRVQGRRLGVPERYSHGRNRGFMIASPLMCRMESMKSGTASRPVVRCDDCHQEFELFSDLANVATCLDGRAHRAVRIARAA